jgi:quercetin 2,3-dioxygenase
MPRVLDRNREDRSAGCAHTPGRTDGRDKVSLDLDERRRLYLPVARGTLDVNGTRLGAGDAFMLGYGKRLDPGRADNAEVLVFDLP